MTSKEIGNRIRNLIVGLLFSGPLLVLSALVPVSAEVEQPKNWLFSINADAAHTTHTTLTLVNAGEFFAFTDRPKRIWGWVTHQGFNELWEAESADTLKKDPPNAVIAGRSSSKDITCIHEVEIEGPGEIDGSDLVYSIKIVRIENPYLRASTYYSACRHVVNASVFIDDFGTTTEFGSATFHMTAGNFE